MSTVSLGEKVTASRSILPGTDSLAQSPLAETGDSVVDEWRRIKRTRTPFSVEFYPPRNESEEAGLWRAARVFERFGAAFATVTYGAGGKTREQTVRLTGELARETTLPIVGHLTIVDHTLDDLRSIVAGFADQGVRNILALRGDPPGDDPFAEWVKHPDGLEYAEDLVRLIHTLGRFHVGVASFPRGHYRAVDLEHDTKYLVQKLRAGAEYSITQIFFDVDDYLRLRDRVVAYDAEQGRKPIIPGVMPITSLKTLRRVVFLSGETIPPALEERLARAAGKGEHEDRKAVRDIGIQLATEMCERLVREGVDCLHFNTMNFSKATVEVLSNLGYTFKA
ncbi:Methylenetetrahydrofolate reductase (NAD(P)H) [Segniliparus rotundus DSM 44985]|uniref:Methylenetetrahydrofolate reductase n=1 Tax=Segniliparus rotundus (strain ATCC BAA-972 / CDC 1076 / CIP 108378 / DSM 44985 / JCM 13578) TaxID=640132 RepID=D6ZF21_SEGRD|nr:Methylenetetrahydrofolate reductase (NAD(P)H) [Segniliparus rotundus DSM 44985]